MLLCLEINFGGETGRSGWVRIDSQVSKKKFVATMLKCMKYEKSGRLRFPKRANLDRRHIYAKIASFFVEP